MSNFLNNGHRAITENSDFEISLVFKLMAEERGVPGEISIVINRRGIP